MHGMCMSGVIYPEAPGKLERQHNCLEARIMPEPQHVLDSTGHFPSVGFMRQMISTLKLRGGKRW